MAALNKFLTWATGAGNNAMSDTDYAANPAQAVGVSVGLADPTLYNKAQRQSAFIAHCMAQFTANYQALDVLDDGSDANFLARFEAALSSYITGGTGATARIRLTTNANFYVDGTSGVDVPANGLASGAAAWKTLQYAYEYLQDHYDLAGWVATVFVSGELGPAAFAGPLVGQSGRKSFQIIASGTSTITAVNASCLIFFDGAEVYFVGSGHTLTLTASGAGSSTVNGASFAWGFGVIAWTGAIVDIGASVVMGACQGGQIAAAYDAVVFFETGGAGTIVSGGGGAWLTAASGGKINMNATAVSFTGSPAFVFETVQCVLQGFIDVSGCVFTGTPTGKRYAVTDTALINTGGAGISFIPGTVVGTASNAFNYQ